MNRKWVSMILIISMLHSFVWSGLLRAQEIRSTDIPAWLRFPGKSPAIQPPPCYVLPFGSELTIFGDSRAFLLATGMVPGNPAFFFNVKGEADGTINGARDPIYGQRIIADGEITHAAVHNLGWPGATATDGEKLDAPVELLLSLALWKIICAFGSYGLFGWVLFLTLSYYVLSDLQKNFSKLLDAVNYHHGQANWNRRLGECILSYGFPVRTSNKIIISIGGNDMKNFYQYMEGFEGLYFFFRVITNPREYLEALLHGRGMISNFSREAFWFWQFEVKEDAIVEEVKSLVQYHLDNLVIPPYQTPNQVMLVSVAPTLSMDMYKRYAWGNLEDWIRLTFYLRRLRDKYQWSIIPHFTNAKYSGRVHFLDMYDRFLTNILFEWASFYFPGDGIHFTAKGNEQLGRMIAAKAVQIKWFNGNKAIPDSIIGTIASGGIVDANNYCTASNPQNCKNESSCRLAAGLNWCGDHCRSGACPAPPPPPPPDYTPVVLCFFFGICKL